MNNFIKFSRFNSKQIESSITELTNLSSTIVKVDNTKKNIRLVDETIIKNNAKVKRIFF